jgi:hypothetical protein
MGDAKRKEVAIGLNTNIDLNGQILHVQTEDYGRSHPLIVTQVFSDKGQVIHQVRFDYSKHLNHENLSIILPKAMRAQHATVIRELQTQAGYNLPELPPDVTPQPCLITDPNPPASAGPTTESPCVHQTVDESIWDKLVAQAQRERKLRKTPHWDEIVKRRHQEDSTNSDPVPVKTIVEPNEIAALTAYNKGLEFSKTKNLEAALVSYAIAIQLQPNNRKYRNCLHSLLSLMVG